MSWSGVATHHPFLIVTKCAVSVRIHGAARQPGLASRSSPLSSPVSAKSSSPGSVFRQDRADAGTHAPGGTPAVRPLWLLALGHWVLRASFREFGVFLRANTGIGNARWNIDDRRPVFKHQQKSVSTTKARRLLINRIGVRGQASKGALDELPVHSHLGSRVGD
jgi:hypothetical protein